MSRKTMYFGLAALLGLFAAIVLIGGLSWGHKAPAGVGNLPVRDGSLEQGKTAPAVVNAKAHALISDFGKVPIYFVPNRGQTDDRVTFYVQGGDKTVYFAPDGVTFAMSYPVRSEIERNPERWVVKLDFLGARKDVKPEGLEKTGAVISYFRGKPEEWKTGLSAYSGIIYPDLWPGIDLVYKGDMDRLKYEFIVHPGADPAKIKLAYRGTERVAVTEEGRLEVKTPAGGFEDDIPIAYQEVDGKQVDIQVTYSLEDPAVTKNPSIVSGSGVRLSTDPEGRTYSYGFVLGGYDRSRALVIDPTMLVYCGYIGGSSGQDFGYAIAIDGSGNAYITGLTESDESSFPATVGPDLTYNGNQDAFIAKVSSSGTGLVYCGYIGGINNDGGYGIAVDDSGNAYVSGSTESTEATFPVTIGPDLTHNGGSDAFVAKVNSSGTDLVYCGYIGGSGGDYEDDIAVDGWGNAYVTGFTNSTEATFPVTIGPDLTHNGGFDTFVAKVDSSGTGLVYCGYIGGSADDWYSHIAVDGSGNAYITGMTRSNQVTFPVVLGPDLTFNGDIHIGDIDIYVAKVDSSGAGLVYCGYIGGSDWEYFGDIAVDDSGNAYVVGQTMSTQATFPVTVGPDLTQNGADDVFIAKVNSSGTGLVYCGYIGGSGGDTEPSVAVDKSGNAYVSGLTCSNESDFPVVEGPDPTSNGGWGDGFVAKVASSGTALVYCGYIGGSGDDQCYGIAVDGLGNAYVTGITNSDQSSFPVYQGPDLTYNGGGDAFIAKVGDIPGPPITFLQPDSANAGDPGFTLSVMGSEFVDGAVVRWDGLSRPTTFVSSTELRTDIGASDLTAGKAVPVTVRYPNGGVSNTLTFTIHNPMPSIASISPTQVTYGGASFMLTVQGSNFVPSSVVRWNGNDKVTTYISAAELQAYIPPQDLWTGGEVQVTVYNPAPSGGASNAITLQVSTFTMGATPTSASVTAGQSATFTIQLTPQYGPFDSPVTFSCTGLPSKCTASFSPASVTPGASSVTTTLTLTTKAASSSAGATLFRATGLGLPTLGLLAIGLTMLLGNVIRKRVPWRLNRRWLAACALVCLVILIGSCSSGGDDNPLYTGTPKGTHQISVQGTSGNMTIPTVVTLVVN